MSESFSFQFHTSPTRKRGEFSFPRSAWERKLGRSASEAADRLHTSRPDAGCGRCPAAGHEVELVLASGDAERPNARSHAERGNENVSWQRLLLIALLIALLTGCGNQVPTQYGRRSFKSVNGTDVFFDMFQQAGHRVRSTRARVSERQRAITDCIVWMPDSYLPPSDKERDWCEEWLTEESGRVLIYVGRDYDSAPAYWEKVKVGAPADKLTNIQRELDDAKHKVSVRREALPDEKDCDWFLLEKKYRSTAAEAPPKKLAGVPGWTGGIDSAKLDLELNSVVEPPFEADILLSLDGDVFVSRQPFETDDGKSHLIVVSNAGFLTNMALVNHEHRKLAARLIGEVGDKRQVLFVETGEGGLDVSEETPEEQTKSSVPERLVQTLLHLAAIGIIFTFCRWPIFGRPKEDRTTHETDFGRHVEALGALLQRCGDSAHAQSRVQHYHQTFRNEIGKRRAKEPPPPSVRPTSGEVT